MAQPNAMEFRVDTSGGVCFECTWISASGEIAPDTPEQFESFLKNEAAIKNNQVTLHKTTQFWVRSRNDRKAQDSGWKSLCLHAPGQPSLAVLNLS